MTKEEIQAATTLLNTLDKNIYDQLVEAINDFSTALDNIQSVLPETGLPSTPAISALSRIRNSIIGASSYEMSTLKNIYNPTPPAPVPSMIGPELQS